MDDLGQPIDHVEGEIECHACGMSTDEFDSKRYCFNCGQALDWDRLLIGGIHNE